MSEVTLTTCEKMRVQMEGMSALVDHYKKLIDEQGIKIACLEVSLAKSTAKNRDARVVLEMAKMEHPETAELIVNLLDILEPCSCCYEPNG